MILYKRDTTGNIRTWQAELDGPSYRTIAGTLDGEKVTSMWTDCVAKNVGKKNEISAIAQAEKEVSAMYTKKIKEGYFGKIEDIDSSQLIKPMLAHKFEDYVDKMKFPVYAQPKLDGFRCNLTKDSMFSRRGEEFNSCPHIFNALAEYAEKYNIIFDGELYNHQYADDFNKLQSLITKKKSTPDDLKQAEALVQYHIYDIVDEDRDFGERYEALMDFFENHTLPEFIYLVPAAHLGSHGMLNEHYAQCLEDGLEGQMIRLDRPYEHKRSKNLLKRKEFQDEEFPIVAIEEGIGNRSDMAGRVTCALPDGRTFGAGIKGGVTINRELWQLRDILPGQMATIKFFQRTPDGIPRFPVFKAVRKVS